MFYYLVESSHWRNALEFKSKLELPEGKCFRITSHNGSRSYPTRFKVVSTLDVPTHVGKLVEITDVDFNVEPF
jgi:hypothetical protein